MHTSHNGKHGIVPHALYQEAPILLGTIATVVLKLARCAKGSGIAPSREAKDLSLPIAKSPVNGAGIPKVRLAQPH